MSSHIPLGDGGKTDYPRKYTKEGGKAYRDSNLWDNLKKEAEEANKKEAI